MVIEHHHGKGSGSFIMLTDIPCQWFRPIVRRSGSQTDLQSEMSKCYALKSDLETKQEEVMALRLSKVNWVKQCIDFLSVVHNKYLHEFLKSLDVIMQEKCEQNSLELTEKFENTLAELRNSLDIFRADKVT